MENLKKLNRTRLSASPATSVAPRSNRHLDFLSAGVGCHCLIALYSLGLVEVALREGFLSIDDLRFSANPLVAKACLQTLVDGNIFQVVDDEYHLTLLGKKVCENIGLFQIFFDGYGRLLAKEMDIAKGSCTSSDTDLNGRSIAEASRSICERAIDPSLIAIIVDLLRPGETLCDLGCGSGSVLEKACLAANCKGIGFEVQQSLFKEDRIVSVRFGDISCLSGEWPDISVVMQRHVFHDFVLSRGAEILESYLLNFPNLKYFVYVDFVSPACVGDSILPGFDYVHSLLGIATPTYDQTIDMFSRAGFEIVSENSDFDMPNTFLWILKPKV